jgi:hypothetical protein
MLTPQGHLREDNWGVDKLTGGLNPPNLLAILTLAWPQLIAVINAIAMSPSSLQSAQFSLSTL